MATQRELAEQFARGVAVERLPSASHVDAVAGEHADLLVGYGWAAYAARDAATGDIVLYEGWRGYSKSTSCQMTELRKGFDHVLGEKGYERSDASPESRTARRRQLAENE